MMLSAASSSDKTEDELMLELVLYYHFQLSPRTELEQPVTFASAGIGYGPLIVHLKLPHLWILISMLNSYDK